MGTAKGIGTRGSQLCIQVAINDFSDCGGLGSRKYILDKKIGLGDITWISPIVKDNFKEYTLPNLPVDLSKKCHLSSVDWSFWRTKQPQWDAIGYTKNNLILVEAKAHIGEVFQNRKKEEITATKNTVEKELGKNPLFNNKLAQIGNRLIFLKNLNKQLKSSGIKVYLVFIYFVNDTTYSPTSLKDWQDFNNHIKTLIETPTVLEPYIKEIYFDVWRERQHKKDKKNEYKKK